MQVVDEIKEEPLPVVAEEETAASSETAPAAAEDDETSPPADTTPTTAEWRKNQSIYNDNFVYSFKHDSLSSYII